MSLVVEAVVVWGASVGAVAWLWGGFSVLGKDVPSVSGFFAAVSAEAMGVSSEEVLLERRGLVPLASSSLRDILC